MQKFFWSTCLAACVCFAASNLQAQTPGQQGAVKGGIAGAIIGGIIGHQNDETGGGVAIGAAVGALAGNVVGRSQEQNAIRQQQQRSYVLQQEQLLQQQAQAQAQASLNRAVSLDDAITLSRSGLSDDLIITQIVNNGVQQEIGVSQVIALHQSGVSEQVIRAMQSAPIGEASIQPSYQYDQVVTPVVVQPAPRVIVHSSPVYRRPTPKPYYHGRPPTRYPSHRSARSYHNGIRIGF